jgi:hypothetical protein
MVGMLLRKLREGNRKEEASKKAEFVLNVTEQSKCELFTNEDVLVG